MKKSCAFLALAAAVCVAAGCASSSGASGGRNIAREKSAFRRTLNRDGYAEVGGYKVEKIKDNVYHMDEGTKALPGGAADSDGNMNNPSSIYFVEGDRDVLIVDLGNPASGDRETDAKVIVEAMAGNKNVTIVITHGHNDHTGLGRSASVFENVKVAAVYIAEPDLTAAADGAFGSLNVAEALRQFIDAGKVRALHDGDTFQSGKREFTAHFVPAHTPGSLMIQDKTDAVLFTGDTFGSGFVWLFWPNNDGNPIAALNDGVSQAQNLLKEMTTAESTPAILAGHRWQQFWEQNAERPGEMSIQYFNDMAQVVTGISNGSTVREDYSARQGGIELSSHGARAKIDTFPEYVDAYLARLNQMDEAYIYNASTRLGIDTVNNTAAPRFIIYPDGNLSDEAAQRLLDDSGLTRIIDGHASAAYVARPSNGSRFTAGDVEGFKRIVGKIYVSNNLKLIGIGGGSTFIAQNLANYMNFVSGLALLGGEGGETPKASVPAYIYNTDAAPYIEADKAEQVGTDGAYTTYQNPNSRYEIVVTSGARGSYADHIGYAWDRVLKRFGRIGNYTDADEVGTWYSRPMISGDEAADAARKYQYFDSVDAIDNIARTVVTEDLNGNGVDSLWYEYVPAQSRNAARGTVPAVFLMHGNTNDPRTQYDTSGWANVASEEGIILICPEWQGHTYQGYTYDPMTSDLNATPDSDFTKVVAKVLEKYPQIDASRVYISGLSAGSRNTLNCGLANPKLFAAGAGHSGPWGIAGANEERLRADIAANKGAYDFPITFFTGDKDEYLRAEFDKLGETMGLGALQAYEELNDMNVTTAADLTAGNIDLYGVPWERTWTIEPTEENIARIKGGLVANSKGVEIEMNRIYGWGHWNYPPAARLMWDFMKKYARDQNTGASIRLDR